MEATIRENGEIVEETEDYVVIAYGDSITRHDIEALAEEGEVNGDIDDRMSDLIHILARDLTDYNWGYNYPVVIDKDNSS